MLDDSRFAPKVVESGESSVPVPAMRHLLSVAVLSLLFTLSARADSSTGPLLIDDPTDWTVKYDNSKGTQLYTLTRTQGENVILKFSHWQAPGTADQMPGFLEQMANKFLDIAKTNPKIKLETDTYRKGEFLGDPFSGNYVEFTIKGGMKQVMFMFSDGNGIWNGQYAGSADGWMEAMETLKAIKKNG